jgi:hypothetical protein
VENSGRLVLAVALGRKSREVAEENGAVGDEVGGRNCVGQDIGFATLVGVVAVGCRLRGRAAAVGGNCAKTGSNSGLGRGGLEVGGEAAAVASLAQLESAVRTAESLVPVQLEPMDERLVIALVTAAA